MNIYILYEHLNLNITNKHFYEYSYEYLGDLDEQFNEFSYENLYEHSY